MKFGVPLEKDGRFSMSFFKFISDNVDDLRMETNKWPDQIIFSGQLGKELFDFLQTAGWDLKQFNPQFEGTVDKVLFKYSKVLTLIDESNAPMLDNSLGKNMISGIPSQRTMDKITRAYSASAFPLKKERTARPQRIVHLIRE